MLHLAPELVRLGEEIVRVNRDDARLRVRKIGDHPWLREHPPRFTWNLGNVYFPPLDTFYYFLRGTPVATYALSGGLEVVSAGGSDTSATLSSGAEQDVFGSASAVILRGGLQLVESGGTATVHHRYRGARSGRRA